MTDLSREAVEQRASEWEQLALVADNTFDERVLRDGALLLRGLRSRLTEMEAWAREMCAQMCERGQRHAPHCPVADLGWEVQP